MTEDEFDAGVRNVPLHYERETVDGKGRIYRNANGVPVNVEKPRYLPPEKRQAALELIRQLHGPQPH
jgi:hypothetical protein